MKLEIRRACDRVAMATRTAKTTSRSQTRLSSEDPGDNEPSSAKKDPTPAESMSGSPDSKGSKGARSRKHPKGGSGGTPGGTPPPSEPDEEDEDDGAETASSTNTSEPQRLLRARQLAELAGLLCHIGEIHIRLRRRLHSIWADLNKAGVYHMWQHSPQADPPVCLSDESRKHLLWCSRALQSPPERQMFVVNES